MRVKDYLRTRGVEFDAINVHHDPDGADELIRQGVRGLPVVAVGGRYAVGLDLAQIDDLLGFDVEASSRTLPGDELVARVLVLLPAAARFAAQLPTAHYDVATPGMEGVEPPLILPDGTPLMLADGTPYVPHRTNIGPVRHIVAHAVKFQHIAEHPEAELSDLGQFAAFGEPTEDIPLEQLCEQLRAIGPAARRWWLESAGRDLDRSLTTFFGPQTQQQLLHSNVVSMAQHTRQLMTVVRDVGIEPDGPLDDRVYSGLELSTEVWT